MVCRPSSCKAGKPRTATAGLTLGLALILVALERLFGALGVPHVRPDVHLAGPMAVLVEVDADFPGVVALDDFVLDVFGLVVVDRSDLVAHLLQLFPVEIAVLPDLQIAGQLLFAFFPIAPVALVAVTGAVRVVFVFFDLVGAVDVRRQPHQAHHSHRQSYSDTRNLHLASSFLITPRSDAPPRAQTTGGPRRPATRLTRNRTMNTTNRIQAISVAAPAMPDNPSTPAINPMITQVTAQFSITLPP